MSGRNARPQLRQYALYGVTTTTSMSCDPDDVLEYKAAQKAGDLRGARILTVKYRFMSEPFTPGSEYKTPEEARAKVDEIAAKGADFVKVWIDAQGGRHPEAHAGIHRRGDGPGEEAQQDPRWRISSSWPTRARIVDQGVNMLVHNVRDQDIPDDFIATLKEKNVSVISTLAREEGAVRLRRRPNGPPLTDNPFFQKGLTPSGWR